MRRRADRPVQRMYRFRMTGLVYLAVTGFLAVAAISSQNNLLFWGLGLSVAGIGVSGVISGLGLMGLRAEREAIPDGSVGDRLVVRYRVSNANRIVPVFGVTVTEREPARRRKVRTPWQRCMSRPVAFVSCVRPGQTIVAEAGPLATGRGEPEFTDFVASSGFPFGLATKSLRFAQRRTALVYPSASEVDPRLLTDIAVGAGRGSSTRRVGDNTGDFYGVREYVPGDAMRSVSWRASARLGELVVRQNATPAPRRLWVRLVLGGAASAEETESTISLAAGVLKVASELGYVVGLLCPDQGVETVPALGRAGLRNALARLATLENAGMEIDPPRQAVQVTGPKARELVVTVAPNAAAAAAAASTPGVGRVLTVESRGVGGGAERVA